MANPGLTTHNPIFPVGTISGNQPLINNLLEGSGAVWQPGTPVQIATSVKTGYTIPSVPSNGTTQVIVKGISFLPGKNLATNGAGASPPFGSIGFPGGLGATQTVPNQPSAYNIYHGAPFIDGLSLVGIANLDTIWAVQVDASSGTTYNYDASIIYVGSTIALAKDTNGWWYADLFRPNTANYADVNIVGFNVQDLVAGSTVTQQNYG